MTSICIRSFKTAYHRLSRRLTINHSQAEPYNKCENKSKRNTKYTFCGEKEQHGIYYPKVWAERDKKLDKDQEKGNGSLNKDPTFLSIQLLKERDERKSFIAKESNTSKLIPVQFMRWPGSIQSKQAAKWICAFRRKKDTRVESLCSSSTNT